MPRSSAHLARISRRCCPAALGLLALLAGAQPGHAQSIILLNSLSLSPSASTVTVGSTVTFTVSLNNNGSGRFTNVGGYDFNVFLAPAQLQFVGTTPFTGTDTDFPTLIKDTLTTPGNMRVSFGESLSATTGINISSTVVLGTFQVKVLTALPVSGSAITFGPASQGANFGGSEVDDQATGANQLQSVSGATVFTPAPEPSGVVTALTGIVGLSLLGWRKRRVS